MGPQIDPESQVTLASVHRGPLFYLLWGPNVRSVLARSGLTVCGLPTPRPAHCPGRTPGRSQPSVGVGFEAVSSEWEHLETGSCAVKDRAVWVQS